MFKFLHAADIHLDSPLKGLGRSDDLPADEIRGATRKALDNLVRLAIDEKVAFVLIAGDVYDGDWKDHNTGLWFVRQMARLRDAKIRVFLIRGNHDAQNKMTAHLPLPDNVHQFRTDRAESVTIAEFDVIIHGQGFASEKVVEDLAARYPAADRACLNIGLLHTSATGRDGHDSYAPCTVDALRSKGYGYWALGHIHKREILSSIDSWIAFSGNIQGRHVRETGPKGCLLVTVDDKREVQPPIFCSLDVLRWESCRIDATGLVDGDDLLQRFEDHVPELLSESDDRPIALRIEVVGACPGHDKLTANLPFLDSALRAKAMGVGGGRVWVEKLKLRTTLERPTGLDEIGDDAIGVLLEILDDYRSDPTALADLASKELAEIRKRIAGEMASLDGIQFDSHDWLRATLNEAQPLLMAKLLG